MVEINRIFRGPNIEFGELLYFIGIWLLMTENLCKNWAEYFNKNPRDLFIECSIRDNPFVSDNHFESI